MNPNINPHIEWETVELHRGRKGSDWFWAIGIIMGTIALVSFFMNNIIFGIFIIISAVALSIHAFIEPRAAYYAVTKEGIVVDNKLYSYSNLDHFHIEDFGAHESAHPDERSKILLKTKSFLFPILYIPLSPDVDFGAVRAILAKHLREETVSEPFLNKFLSRYLS